MVLPSCFCSGYPVRQFLQRDLSQSAIYYHQKHGEHVLDDFFEVVLSDAHDPPNLSESQVSSCNALDADPSNQVTKEFDREHVFYDP